jgi:hypothetical protein
MTDALAVINSPAPMRILDSPIGKVIPVIDIVDYIGYSRSAITKAMKVWEGKISPHKIFLPLETTGGTQHVLCLDRMGVDYLFLFIRPSKSRMSVDQLMEFRKSTMDKMGAAKPEPDRQPAIDTELLVAKHLSEQTGGDLVAFQAIALKKCGMEEYIPALKQPSMISGEQGWYTVTQLCEKYPTAEIEGHPERLNYWLLNHGYIYREQSGLPRLQPKGEPHGMEYWYESPHGHREIRIRWRLSIMYACGLVKDDH